MTRQSGFTMIELMVVIAIIVVIAAIAIPNLLPSREAANEASAIASLRSLNSAQALFRQSNSDGDGVQDYGTLAELGDGGFIDSNLGGGTKSGYAFVIIAPNEVTYSITATPTSEPAAHRHFFTDISGVIRQNFGAPADETSDPI